jgi:excisionase family DNA binding protein
MDTPIYLTTAQAAAILEVTPARVRQLVSAGELRGQHHGRDLLITRADLDDYLPRRRPVGRVPGFSPVRRRKRKR